MKIVSKQLERIIEKSKIKFNEPLKKYTYAKVGGNADFLIMPETIIEVQKIIKFAYEQKINVTVLGNGSNVIINDNGIRGIVILMNNLKSVTVRNEEIIAQAGASVIEISKIALDNSLTGIEFSCGIPATVGGAVIMNAGAYGGEMKDILKSVKVVDKKGKLKNYTVDELNLNYRTSALTAKGDIVVEASFQLEQGVYKHISNKMANLTAKRESKQPLEFPSCGSVFKRPEGFFAGKLIQDSCLQGCSVGDAQVSKKHAGFIINRGKASATDYIELIEIIQNTVYEKFKVNLEREVKILNEEGKEI